MLSPRNPFTENLVNNFVDNAEFYGVDPESPSPFENRDNNVVVPELNITGDIDLIKKLCMAGLIY